jgi:hypothetical protein
MKRARQFLLMLVLTGTMVLNGGCIVAAVGLGAGTVAYVRGDLQTVESAGIDDVYNASLKAVQELELRVATKSKDALAAEIIAYDAQDKKITIKLKAAAEGTTKLSIRIGVFGSETKSRLIYQKIHDILQS